MMIKGLLATCVRGASSIEYGLIASLIALAAVSAIGGFGEAVNENYTNTAIAIDESI